MLYCVLSLSASAHDGVSTTRSAAAAVIPAHGKAVVPTDLAIACPPGTYARIAPRSGLAVKHFIDTGAGHTEHRIQQVLHHETGAGQPLCFSMAGTCISRVDVEAVFVDTGCSEEAELWCMTAATC